VFYIIYPLSSVQCNTQMQVHFLFLKNTANDSMVDLMACKGTVPVFSTYNVTFSWPHRQIKGVVANSHSMDLQHLIHCQGNSIFSQTRTLCQFFQTMLDNSPLDSGSRETLPF